VPVGSGQQPHRLLVAVLDIPGYRAIVRGAQEQVATFFATDGAVVIHPEPARFFEVPISLPLPEDLNYILPPPGPRGAVAPMLGVARTPAAASRSGATFADMGISAAREDWAAVTALLTASPGQPPPPSPLPLSPRERGRGEGIDTSAPSERPTPPSLDVARVDLFFAATDAEDPRFGLSSQERPGPTDDWWLDLVPTNRSLSRWVPGSDS
jgi:hypothetical protein